MLILAIDTSAPPGGITLAQAEENAVRVIESAPIAGGTFSAQLVPTLAALLQRHGYAAKDLGGFAAASGPGSFTGLRVGLSAIKGLAEVLRRPIATVSVLEAMALGSARQGTVAAALDAGRSEVFAGIYEVTNGTATRQREELLSQASFLEALRGANLACAVTSDAAIAALASGANLSLELVPRPGSEALASGANLSLELVPRPGSEAIAAIGARKLLAGDTVPVEALDANYLRRSDAELFFKGTR